MEARRRLAGQQRRPGRRADRFRVGAGEAQPLPGQAVEARGLVIPAAIAAQVVDAQVVGQDEDDVRPGLVLFRPCRAAGQQEWREQGQQDGQVVE